EGRVSVLDRVVKEPGDDRNGVELEARQDLGDAERMREIGITRGPRLRAMGLHRKNVGAVEGVLIRARIVGLDALDQLELTNHRHVRIIPLASPLSSFQQTPRSGTCGTLRSITSSKKCGRPGRRT